LPLRNGFVAAATRPKQTSGTVQDQLFELRERSPSAHLNLPSSVMMPILLGDGVEWTIEPKPSNVSVVRNRCIAFETKKAKATRLTIDVQARQPAAHAFVKGHAYETGFGFVSRPLRSARTAYLFVCDATNNVAYCLRNKTNPRSNAHQWFALLRPTADFENFLFC
jgi:hypothetical protein